MKKKLIQRRSLRSLRDIKIEKNSKKDFVALRPCPIDSLEISKINEIEGETINRDIMKGDYLKNQTLKNISF